jgi:hypothetical protein
LGAHARQAAAHDGAAVDKGALLAGDQAGGDRKDDAGQLGKEGADLEKKGGVKKRRRG